MGICQGSEQRASFSFLPKLFTNNTALDTGKSLHDWMIFGYNQHQNPFNYFKNALIA